MKDILLTTLAVTMLAAWTITLVALSVLGANYALAYF